MNKILTSIRFLSFITMALFIVSYPDAVCAQGKAQADSTVNVIRLKMLKKHQMELKKKIEMEDKKRNRTLEGVSTESLDQMNLVQDSICLELRSELISVELEIRELIPNAIPTRLIQQYNHLRHSQPQKPAGTSSSQMPSGKKE